MVQAFNDAAERLNSLAPEAALNRLGAELGGEVMVDCACGLASVVLGILALVGINAPYLVASALIVFGSAFLLSGIVGPKETVTVAIPGAGEAQMTPRTALPDSAAMRGMEVLIGFAAVVLGILSLVLAASWVLTLVGFIALGVALLLVSATFSAALLRVSATP
jgi:nucleoside permease NupC